MTDPLAAAAAVDPAAGEWTTRLVWFLRGMAGLALVKGLYHWSLVTGIGAGSSGLFEASPTSWQAATIFFAVIDLVAAVGLWLAAAWGAVVWLTSAVSMAAVEMLCPQVYGGRLAVVLVEVLMIAAYAVLAVQAARERPR
jgi:Family of unknown function (DUF6163)